MALGGLYGHTTAPTQTAEGHPTVSIRESITPVPGYPKKLVIYPQKASSYWWARHYDCGKIHKKARDKSSIFKFATEFDERSIAQRRASTTRQGAVSISL
jgi:hypothetical protein